MKNAHGSVPRSEERVLRRIERSKKPTNEGSERERKDRILWISKEVVRRVR